MLSCNVSEVADCANCAQHCVWRDCGKVIARQEADLPLVLEEWQHLSAGDVHGGDQELEGCAANVENCDLARDSPEGRSLWLAR
jgi:hypothetical protein